MDPTCPTCGGPLVKPKRGPMPTYCSASCKTRAWEDRNREATETRQAERVAQRSEAWAAQHPDVPCPYCGGPMRPHRKSCPSSSCRREHTAKRQREWQAAYREKHGQRHGTARYAEARADHRDARRAWMAGADSEEFDRIEVFERDGWVCGICTLPVDPDLDYPDPMSRSLDHVIPLSHGGPHTRANTRCSHLICNARRGDRAA